jgi:formylmethanofuran dehydrogenase subunit B
MRESGAMLTTASEARLRADPLLVVGGSLYSAWPELAARLLSPPAAPELAGGRRRTFLLCPGRGRRPMAGRDQGVTTIGGDPADLPPVLAALRARVAGRPVSRTAIPPKTLDSLASDLSAAKFGVAVWSAAELDALTIEMLCGLVDDLNAGTRFTGLCLPPGDNALGVLQACGWMTGLPMRTGFGRGYPEHDPWRFSTGRLLDSGEADCVLWISAYQAVAPPPTGDAALIVLACGDAVPYARVSIEVGRPGIDHDAVEYLAATASLAPVAAALPAGRISVAQALADIASALPGGASSHADLH